MKRMLRALLCLNAALLCLCCANPTSPSTSSSVPATPTGVTATAGDGQVILLWTAVSGATSYEVFYKAGASASISDTQAAAAMIAGTGATITGLSNGSEYAFIVVAGNADGKSAASQAVTVTPTAAAAVPAPPSHPTIAAGTGQVTVTWSPVSGATGYKLFYKAGATATASDTPVPAAMIAGTTATITGLAGGTTYACIIVATNSFGDGQPSGAVATMTFLDPTTADTRLPDSAIYGNGRMATISGLANGTQYAFVVYTTDADGVGMSISNVATATPRLRAPGIDSTSTNAGQVVMHWYEVPGAIGYKVFYAVGATVTSSDTQAPATMISGTTATITGLANETPYSFIVMDYDSTSDGRASAVKTLTPTRIPQDLQQWPGAEGNVTIKWTSVTGASSYKVVYKAGLTATTSDTQAAATCISDNTAGIPDLLNGTQYSFIVVSTFPEGDSAPSAPVTITPQLRRPNLSNPSPGPGQVSLSWGPVMGAAGYKVYYAAGDTATIHDVPVPTAMIGTYTATVTGLESGRQYAFIVAAYDATSEGPPSWAKTATPTGPAHSFADAGGAMTAYSDGLSAAIASTDSSASAYNSVSGSTYTLCFKDYISEGYTLNGSLTEVLYPLDIDGAIDMTGGSVTRIAYHHITGTSGTLVISFYDATNWTYDYATSGFAQN